MPQRWQMRMAGALPVGIDESASSWCFVKLGSSVEIARPVVVSEKGDSRVSRKWERLALRGSILCFVLFVRWSASSKRARRRVRCSASSSALWGVRIQLALFYPQDYGFDGGRFERSSATSQHFNAVAAASSRLLSGS